MSSEGTRLVFTSGECEIDLMRREIRVLGSPVPVGGRAFEMIEIAFHTHAEGAAQIEALLGVPPRLLRI